MLKREQLLALAEEARETAYVPYSGFKVGAVVVAKDGRVFKGCNIENASYSPTNCAERTAIFKAVSEGVREFDAIAVVADTPGPCHPCGVCRQVIAEFFTPDARVYLGNLAGDVKETSIDQLLPGAFSAQDMKGTIE